MIGNLLFKTGLALMRKSALFGFNPQNATEQVRKFAAIYPQLAAGLGIGEASWTGKTVTEYTAMNCSAVWACTRVIAETVGSLPLHLMQQSDSGKRVAIDHPLYKVLHDEPNEETDDMTFREMLTAHCVTWGNAYAMKVRRGGTTQTIGLWPWTPNQVHPARVVKDNRLVYVVKDGNAAEKTYEKDEVFHLRGLGWDGLRGYSVVSMARQSIALAQIQDEYVAKFFAAGGRKPYYLHKTSKFKTDQDFEQFRERWEGTYNGPFNFHRAPILEGDIELKELGMPLEDAQLLASRQFSVPEICRWFRISPHLVGDLSRATFSNIEHLAIEFIQQTLMAWCVRWEKAIKRQLLTEGEKKTYFAKHNFNALLRGDFKSRMEGYASALQNGVYSIDDVLDLEDRNPLPNGAGAARHIQLNQQTLPGTGEPTAAERAALAKISQQGGVTDGNQAN